MFLNNFFFNSELTMLVFLWLLLSYSETTTTNATCILVPMLKDLSMHCFFNFSPLTIVHNLFTPRTPHYVFFSLSYISHVLSAIAILGLKISFSLWLIQFLECLTLDGDHGLQHVLQTWHAFQISRNSITISVSLNQNIRTMKQSSQYLFFTQILDIISKMFQK